MKKLLTCVVVLCLICCTSFIWARTVVVISIDGMRPDYVTQTDQHGLKLPNLTRFMTQGTYADGVIGVAPTVTYPSHTTLMTGVWPAEHGIFTNQSFDPLRQNMGGWYWYATDIRVQTLWEAASKAGILVASVGWPVSVDAKGVTYLIPEYWRAKTPDDRLLIEALSRPDGWLAEREKKLGPYDDIGDGSIEGDVAREKYALDILRAKKPGFMTIHLAALDHAEHLTGPFSAHSNETLEALDKMVGEIEDAALTADPEAVVVVVSDHGFERTDHKVNLALPFVTAGLIRLKKGSVDSWDAALWSAGGCAAVVLRDPSDATTYAKTKALLEKMKADPQYAIARVLEQPEIRSIGAFPNAAFLVEMKPGYQQGIDLTGDAVVPIPSTGMHGYLPDNPDMRASFFVQGKGIASGRDLGMIDMRQIAPTIAGLLSVTLPAAKEKPLNVAQ
ncbi:MAG: ectonucleotide pyrophosphatase/phosphodiesterase [Terracidiphilus sp.]